MKTIFAIILICSFSNLYGLAFDDTGYQFDIRITADTYIRADIASSANWYKTTMPGYTLGFTAGIPKNDFIFHEIALLLYYFESNQFAFNTQALDTGTMRLLVVNSTIKYLCHLSLNSLFSFIIGGNIIPRYEQISNIISTTDIMAHEDLSIYFCPTFGFSIAHPSFFNFQIEFLPGLALPITNKLLIGDKSSDDYQAIHCALTIRNALDFSINKIRLGVFYHYTLNADIYYTLNELDSHLIDSRIQHYSSFGISLGYRI